MRALDVIEAKRDGKALSRKEIEFFVNGLVAGDIPDYQAAAWLMAVYLRGLDPDECAALTSAMAATGARLPRLGPPGPRAGKHSTGGVGDKATLIVVPLAASMGMAAPKLSGRGLGHTGGTLDKLASIPGLRTDLDQAAMAKALEKAGCFIAGQTPETAPADKILYHLRDATATVAEPGLIAASIMSKKLAENLDALVLDVKCGRGAFCREMDQATALARNMAAAGRAAGVATAAVVTAMDQPLGRAVGNALEVAEAARVLAGESCPESRDLVEACLALAGWMAHLCGLADSPEQGAALARTELESGRGLERLALMAEAQGGDPDAVSDPSRLPVAAHVHPLLADRDGFVARADALEIGRGMVRLGAGRQRKEDAVDPAVGMVLEAKVGRRVTRGQPLALIHYNDEARLEAALGHVRNAFVLSPEPRPRPPCLLAEIGPDGEMRPLAEPESGPDGV